MNIYGDVTTIYECTSKSLDDQRVAVDLSSDRAPTSQWVKNWLVTFDDSKIKLVTFHPIGPGTTTSHNERISRAISDHWASNATHTLSGTDIYELSLKIHEKWTGLCIAPISISLIV